MTVAELIEELQLRPQDADIVIDAGGRYVEIEAGRIGIERLLTRGQQADHTIIVLRTWGRINDEA